MKSIRLMKVELTNEEVLLLNKAQKLWQDIADAYDDMCCDIGYIVDELDENLSQLFEVCDDGISEW